MIRKPPQSSSEGLTPARLTVPVPSAVQIICVQVPVKIISEANARSHWAAKAKRVHNQRFSARMALGGDFHKRPAVPATITLTRIGPRELDGDNLQSGFKAVRDGVADWLGIDDGDKRLTWCYEQRRGKPKEYAAEIRIEHAVSE